MTLFVYEKGEGKKCWITEVVGLVRSYCIYFCCLAYNARDWVIMINVDAV